ncbi:MAG: amidohydrolase family protein, partial [Candidatus Eremiobacteraeota bacterium]|nr:amidohydrolase family protein [Candidatus Eremiobacteraeota bacterium]
MIGDLSERDAFTRIPCNGLALAPGFIDIHSHSDEWWLISRATDSKIAQGVTTEIGGNCGSSVAPLRGYARERRAEQVKRVNVDVQWSSFDEFFREVERNGVALNVASLVGLGTTRACIAGPADRPLERDELRAQDVLVRDAVDEGALGVSSGLIYEPGRYADVSELARCARAARDAGAPRYVTHLRDEGDRLLDAVNEALEIGARAEVAVQLSHHKAAWRRNWGKVHASLERVDRARAAGAAVACDVYPYVAMWTDLDTILPGDVRDGGGEATLARLRDPRTATAIALALNLRFSAEEWHDMLVTSVGSERNAGLAGMRLDEIARERGLQPARAAVELLLEERLEVQCAFFAMDEDDVATVLSAGFCAVASDASTRGFTGVTAHGVPHPRAFGCFPRVYRRFVRARKTIAIEEAVRRMTSLPASLFEIRRRGTIETDAYADLVVFDPERIGDRATYEHPFVAPEGIAHVFVNGEP